MSSKSPTPPRVARVRTYRAIPVLDRLAGRATVEWETPEGVERMRVRTRFRDLEGNRPSLYSLMRLPRVLRTWLLSRWQPFLRQPVPPLVLDAVEFLKELVPEGTRVLEVGSGNSTLWLLGRGAEVLAIEHSAERAAALERHVAAELGAPAASRLEVYVAEGDEAVRLIERAGDASFQLALIDCCVERTSRADCVRAARPKLEQGGWMVVDDSDHPLHRPALALMSDLPRIRFTGYAPTCTRVSQTSFWQITGAGLIAPDWELRESA